MMKLLREKPPLVDAALDLARQDHSVIPVGPDKKPLTSWKDCQSERATPDLLQRWFGSGKAWGLAIVTGAVSGRVVLDIDSDEGFAALRTRGFDIPPTLQVRTPRGGAHLYFQDPGLPTRNFTGGLKTCPLPQVDFRGEGGYVVAPPSPGYKYLNDLPLVPLPAWLKALVIPGWSLLDEAIDAAREGNRNETGFNLACQLRDRGITRNDAEPLLRAYADAVRVRGTPPYQRCEALASLDSAFKRSPRAPLPDEEKSARQSQASRLVEFAADVELFHAADQKAFAAISIDNHQENWPVRSKLFKQYLARKYFEGTGRIPNASALTDAITVLEGQALFTGPEHDVSLRVAAHEGGIVLDLCNSAWEVAVVDTTGWIIEKASPVKFRRSRGMLPLPTPDPGGSLDELRTFLHLADDKQWRLLAAWMLHALRPTGPYPVLSFQGEQGSGKSSAMRYIRSIIDPNVADVRSENREPRDLMISASNTYLQAFDNLSGLPPWLSDAFCRLSTGGGFATRELYTDADELILVAVRPIILNGIDAIITRSDLLDRALMLTLPAFDEKQVRPEAALLQAFEEARPRLFGALLTALSKAMKQLPDVHLDRLPRMADFEVFGVAVERALGWPSGSFSGAYKENRDAAHEIALEGSPIVAPLEDLLEAGSVWRGTASELLKTLEGIDQPHGLKHRRGWPATPRQLGAHLARLAPNLRAIGITMEKERSGHDRNRIISLKRELAAKSSSASSACPQGPELNKLDADKVSGPVVRRLVRKTVQAFADKHAGNGGQQDNHRLVRAKSHIQSGFSENADDADNENASLPNGHLHPRLAALQTMWKGVTPRFETDGVGNGVKPPTHTNKRR